MRAILVSVLSILICSCSGGGAKLYDDIDHVLQRAEQLLKNAERAEKDFYANYPDPE